MRNGVLLLVSAMLIAAYAGGPADAQQPAADVPTFTRDVAPILFKHCVNCHRPGEMAPMSLLTYESARPYARAIANAIGNRTMPPWHADAPTGTFDNERSLTDRERQTLVGWLTGGAPNGDPKDLPPPPTFTEGWNLGKPDLVLEMQEDYRLPAKGTIQVPNGSTFPRTSASRNGLRRSRSGRATGPRFIMFSSITAQSPTRPANRLHDRTRTINPIRLQTRRA